MVTPACVALRRADVGGVNDRPSQRRKHSHLAPPSRYVEYPHVGRDSSGLDDCIVPVLKRERAGFAIPARLILRN